MWPFKKKVHFASTPPQRDEPDNRTKNLADRLGNQLDQLTIIADRLEQVVEALEREHRDDEDGQSDSEGVSRIS